MSKDTTKPKELSETWGRFVCHISIGKQNAPITDFNMPVLPPRETMFPVGTSCQDKDTHISHLVWLVNGQLKSPNTGGFFFSNVLFTSDV